MTNLRTRAHNEIIEVKDNIEDSVINDVSNQQDFPRFSLDGFYTHSTGNNLLFSNQDRHFWGTFSKLFQNCLSLTKEMVKLKRVWYHCSFSWTSHGNVQWQSLSSGYRHCPPLVLLSKLEIVFNVFHKNWNHMGKVKYSLFCFELGAFTWKEASKFYSKNWEWNVTSNLVSVLMVTWVIEVLLLRYVGSWKMFKSLE